MIPIQDLLNRIRWDPEFGRSNFEIAYLDKVSGERVRVPFSEARFSPGEHFGFELIGVHGEEHFIPLHRVREVYRDGTLIWQRPDH